MTFVSHAERNHISYNYNLAITSRGMSEVCQKFILDGKTYSISLDNDQLSVLEFIKDETNPMQNRWRKTPDSNAIEFVINLPQEKSCAIVAQVEFMDRAQKERQQKLEVLRQHDNEQR